MSTPNAYSPPTRPKTRKRLAAIPATTLFIPFFGFTSPAGATGGRSAGGIIAGVGIGSGIGSGTGVGVGVGVLGVVPANASGVSSVIGALMGEDGTSGSGGVGGTTGIIGGTGVVGGATGSLGSCGISGTFTGATGTVGGVGSAEVSWDTGVVVGAGEPSAASTADCKSGRLGVEFVAEFGSCWSDITTHLYSASNNAPRTTIANPTAPVNSVGAITPVTGTPLSVAGYAARGLETADGVLGLLEARVPELEASKAGLVVALPFASLNGRTTDFSAPLVST